MILVEPLVSSRAARISGHSAAHQRGVQRRRERMAGRRPAGHRRALQSRPGGQSDRPASSCRGPVPLLRALRSSTQPAPRRIAGRRDAACPSILPGRPARPAHPGRQLCAEARAGRPTSCSNSIPWRRSRRWSRTGTPRRSCRSAASIARSRAGTIVARRIVSPSLTRTLIVGETVRRPKTPATTAVVQCLREEVERLVAAGLWTGPNVEPDCYN